jgi:hypothetical protein
MEGFSGNGMKGGRNLYFMIFAGSSTRVARECILVGSKGLMLDLATMVRGSIMSCAAWICKIGSLIPTSKKGSWYVVIID